MVVTVALDEKKIQKRNIQAIDEKVSESVETYIQEQHPKLSSLLHE